MRPRRLRVVGLLLICAGAVVLAGPTVGFEAIGADRVVDVGVADDEANALLGLQTDYDGTRITYEETWWGGQTYTNATVANVTNNVDESLSVSVEVGSVDWPGGDDRVLAVANAGDFASPVAPGGTRAVVLSCSGAVAGNASDATVRLTYEATGSGVSIDRYEYPVPGVAFDCAGPSGGDGDPPEDPVPIENTSLRVVGTPTAESGGVWSPDSRVAFDLENAGPDAVTIAAIHVADSTAGTRVQHPDTEVDVAASTSGSLDASDGLSVGSDAPRYDLDRNATIAAGGTGSVTLGQFRTGSSWFDQVDMGGETVTVVLYVEGVDVDGRSGPVPLELELNVQ